MARPPIDTTASRGGLRPGVEYEFERLTLPRHMSRNAVTRLLTEQAERAGWELAHVRIAQDGTRRVVLRRKIIRQLRFTA